ncbi:Sec-independent protein translocase protein TatB [Paraburkholderia phenazinium]|jgi:sec-independent protein translocase protein TatB|uniref:Sec-independent protein translocase protein TatB n=1 Tax=Paraburkholderia phenazinium TaxID=60549 RepID=A0A1N6IEI0_9BURK|nr:Sec-independent protein translocase protein TatB [Paraburkholderia phenazinium]SIO30440.1 sec-independent protein translocase protein TatB [Paraburkholderia phenazinium]
MLDLGLTKMAVIGVVSLVVLGPERLPHVARTAGALLGRAQRYISDVKDEVTREIELGELQQVKNEFVAAAANIESTIHDNLREQETELKVAFNGASTSLPDVANDANDAVQSPSQGLDTVSWRTDLAAAPKRRNWRGKRTVTPTWYKRAAAHRRRVQSVAAREARQPAAYAAARHGFFNV